MISANRWLASTSTFYWDEDGNTVGVAQTDQPGWYAVDYQHKGKKAEYTVQMDLDGALGHEADSAAFELAGSTKFVELSTDGTDIFIG